MTISIITTTDLGTTLSLVNNKVSVVGIGGGSANQIPVQVDVGTTSFIAAPTTAGTALTWNGSAYTWASPSGSSAVTSDNSVNLVSIGATVANGGAGVTLGPEASQNGSATVTLGYRSQTTTNGGIAVGGETTAGYEALAIGYGAKATDSHSVAVGPYAQSLHSSSVVIVAGSFGDTSCQSTAPNQVVIGSGQNTEYVLHGSLSFGGAGAGGTAGQVLMSTGNGTSPTWSTPTSGGAAGPLEVDSNTIITSSAVTAAGGIAIGYLTTVSGNGIAIGTQSTATSSESTAVGSLAEATGAFSSAFGKGARSWGSSSIALGADAYAEESGVALGAGSSARSNSIAIGTQVNAASYQAVIGSTSITETHLFGSLVFDYSSGTAGQVLTSTGNGTSPIWGNAGGGGAVVLDDGMVANLVSSNASAASGSWGNVVLGGGTSVTSSVFQSVVIGSGGTTTCAGSQSLCLGFNGNIGPDITGATALLGTAISNGGIAIGAGSIASGDRGISIGQSASTLSTAIAIGANAAASALGTALGLSASANAGQGVAIGNQATAQGVGSIAIGTFAYTDADQVTAIGPFVMVAGAKSTVIGSTNDNGVPNSVILADGDGHQALSWALGQNSDGCVQYNNSASWSVSSDAMLKTNIKPITGGLARINQLSPVEFDHIETGQHDDGFLAQDYQTVFPAQVGTRPDGMLSITPNLNPWFVSAIQELDAKVEALQDLVSQQAAVMKQQATLIQTLLSQS